MSANPYLDAFSAKVNSHPDGIFIRSIHGKSVDEVSFGAFDQRLKSAVAGLRKHGVGRGDVVLVFSGHGVDTLCCFVACQVLGAIPSFMPPPTARQDLSMWQRSHDRLVKLITPKLTIGDDQSVDALRSLNVPAVPLGSLLLEPGEAALAITAAPSDVAFLQHSSGTTGLKKGVMVTYDQLFAQLRTYAKSLEIDTDRNTVVSWLPIYHDMGLVAATLLPIFFGMPITAIETFTWLANPTLMIEWLSKAQAPVTWLPNFAFRYLADRARKGEDWPLNHVHAVTNCSEPCKTADMEAFIARFRPNGLQQETVRVCYAMAEYVFAVTQTPRSADGSRSIEVDADALELEGRIVPPRHDGSQVRRIASVGFPIDGTEVRIRSDGQDVGEIEVTGVSLCSGYYRNEEQTRKKFVDGWYRTGDFGFMVDGQLYVTGRMDDLIIVRGKNIYAHDVEAVMTLTGKIKPGRCVAFGVEDKRSGTQNLVVAAETAGAPPREVVRAINDMVSSEFGISPADIVVLDENTLIKTTSGKISRSENAARYISGTLKRWGGDSGSIR